LTFLGSPHTINPHSSILPENAGRVAVGGKGVLVRLSFLDIAVFIVFFAIVLGVSMYKSRREKTGEDYFLASRGLIWPIIGFSLIAANISSEHFVGMAGQGAGIAGMAIASYEWMAAVTLVIVAFVFLPRFLRSGIFTIPEYLEYRYNSTARTIMAFYMMAIYVGVTLAAVLYSGGVTLQTLFGDIHNPNHLLTGIVVIGIIGAAYTIWGGLKAAAWADLFQGSALIAGGILTMILGFKAIGVKTFFAANADRLHMILPADHSVLPWTALVVGLWIPNFYYWGLNQYITQKTLAAKSLRQGQMGAIFAACLKLLIPFIIILPGLMSRQLYGHLMTGASGTDAAYPMLIRNLVGPGARAFIFAAITGAVISTLAAMLNSASTIFTMDIFRRLFKKDASQKDLIRSGRLSTLAFAVVGCVIAPMLASPSFHGIFNYIQEFQGYISPGILAAFVFGLVFKRAPASAGVAALALTAPIYGFLQWQFGTIAFLNRMAITFAVILAVMAVITALKPLPEPRTMPVREGFDMKRSKTVVWIGALVIAATVALYIIFW
jgi:SSS family solute:Na+ symporter